MVRRVVIRGKGFCIDEDELRFKFIRASGPGGQNVNKLASAVQLKFDVRHSPSLPGDVLVRLIALGGKRVSARGVLTIDARRFRSQERNRQDAIDRLARLIERACVKPRPRKKTRPSAAAQERRLQAKRKRAAHKRLRQLPSLDE